MEEPGDGVIPGYRGAQDGGVSDVSNFHTKEPCNHGTLMMEGMLEIKASEPCDSQPIKLKPKEVPLRSHGSIVAELGLNNTSSIKHTVYLLNTDISRPFFLLLRVILLPLHKILRLSN